MTDAPNLEIAAVRFTPFLPAGSRLVTNDPHYGPFLLATGSTPERIDVSARLVLGGAPDTGDLPLLFDTGSAWCAFRDGEDLLLELTLPETGASPLWLARVPPGVPRDHDPLRTPPRCRLRRIDARDTLRQLLPTASILWYDRERVEQSLAFCEQLTSRIPAYDLHFEPGPAVRDVLSDLL